MNQENHDRQWESEAEEKIRGLFQTDNLIEEFKNSPDIQRQVVEILNLYGLPSNKYLARTIEDIIGRPSPPPIPIIAEGILTFDSQACIVAYPKVGKSLFAIQLGLRLAQGGDCLGLEVVRPCKVLYCHRTPKKGHLWTGQNPPPVGKKRIAHLAPPVKASSACLERSSLRLCMR